MNAYVIKSKKLKSNINVLKDKNNYFAQVQMNGHYFNFRLFIINIIIVVWFNKYYKNGIEFGSFVGTNEYNRI